MMRALHHEEGHEPFENTGRALLMIVLMMLVGYSAERGRLLPSSTEEVVSQFIFSLALPALLFRSIATLVYTPEMAPAVGGVLLAKLLVVAFGRGLAQLITRQRDASGGADTLGGLFALLCTMSDDIGVGVPVFSAIYSADSPYIGMLYVQAAFQSMLINPIAFTMLALGRAKSTTYATDGDSSAASGCAGRGAGPTALHLQRGAASPQQSAPFAPTPASSGLNGRCRPSAATAATAATADGSADALARDSSKAKEASQFSLRAGTATAAASPPARRIWLQAFLDLQRNPPVVAVVLGLAYRLGWAAFVGGASVLPWWLEGVVEMAGAAFAPLVLFLAGYTSAGSLDALGSLQLSILPLMLVGIKMLVFPILVTTIVYALGGAAQSWVLLYGLLPCANSIIAIAGRYKLDRALKARLATALLLGRIVSFWLLLLASGVSEFGFTSMRMRDWARLLSLSTHAASVVGAAAVLLRGCAATSWRSGLMARVLALAALQAGYSAAFFAASVAQFRRPATFAVVSAFRWASHGWLLAMSIEQAAQCRAPITEGPPQEPGSSCLSKPSSSGSMFRTPPRIASATQSAELGSPARASETVPEPSRSQTWLLRVAQNGWTHVATALAFAVAMTLPWLGGAFSEVASDCDYAGNSHTHDHAHIDVALGDSRVVSTRPLRPCPLDAVLWVPYFGSCQGTVYIVAYGASGVVVFACLRRVLMLSREAQSTRAHWFRSSASGGWVLIDDDDDDDDDDADGRSRCHERPSPPPSIISASHSFLQPSKDQVGLDFRAQLMCAIFLLRCICDAATLGGFERLRALAAEEDHARMEMPSQSSLLLVFFMFIFFEDGQGVFTSLLFVFRRGEGNDKCSVLMSKCQKWVHDCLLGCRSSVRTY